MDEEDDEESELSGASVRTFSGYNPNPIFSLFCLLLVCRYGRECTDNNTAHREAVS